MPSEVRAPERHAVEAMTPRRADVAKLAVGTVAIVAWGFCFDQLTRVAGWVLDTSDALYQRLLDLHSRYNDAHYALIHYRNFYGYRHGAFTYPPITAYLFVPFHAIGWHATAVLWTVANVVALAVLLWIVLWRFFAVRKVDAWLWSCVGLAPAAILVLFPFRSLLFWGQLALFLLLVTFVDLFCVPVRYRGVLIGIATAVKLLPALFVLWFLTRRQYGAVARVAGAFVALTALAAVLWPHASAQYWFHILPTGKDVSMVANPLNLPTSLGRWYFGVGKVNNQSLRGTLGRPPFDLPGTFPWVLAVLVVLVVGGYATVRMLGQRRDLTAFVVLSATTVLVSPVSWLHYWVFVVLGPFVAILEWRRDRALAIGSILLAVCTCANLEDTRLTGLFAPGEAFAHANGLVVFGVRNLYVLGGLVFLGVAAWSAWRARDAEPAVASALSATP